MSLGGTGQQIWGRAPRAHPGRDRGRNSARGREVRLGGVCGGRGRAGKWFGGKLGGALRPGGAWRVGARGWPAGGWPPRVGQLGSCFAAQPAARLAGPSAQLSRQPARRASLPAQLECLRGVQPPREPVGKGLPTKPNLHPARNFRHYFFQRGGAPPLNLCEPAGQQEALHIKLFRNGRH